MVWSHGVLRSKIFAFKNGPRFDCQYESEIYTFQFCDVCALLALQQIVKNGKMRLYIVFNCEIHQKTKKWELRIKVFLKHLKYVRKYIAEYESFVADTANLTGNDCDDVNIEIPSLFEYVIILQRNDNCEQDIESSTEDINHTLEKLNFEMLMSTYTRTYRFQVHGVQSKVKMENLSHF